MNRLKGILHTFYLPLLVMAVMLCAAPAFAGCMSAPDRLADFLVHCYICDFAEILLATINTVATNSFDAMSGTGGPAIRLLALGFAFWLVWHIGSMFINYKYSDPAEFITELGKCAFRVTFIAAILVVASAVAVDFVISPIITMATEIILELIDTDLVSTSIANINNNMTGWDHTTVNAKDYCTAARHIGTMNGDGKVLSPQVINSLLCIVQSIYVEVSMGAIIGLGIQCAALDAYWLVFITLPNIPMWIIGTIIYLVFLFITLAVSFSLVDFIVRIGFVIVMLPLVLVAWVFPISRVYTKKAWDLFLNSLVSLLALTVAMGLIVSMMGSVLGDSTEIQECINNDRMHDLYNLVYTNGVDFVLFIVMLFISVLLTKSAASVACHFVPISVNLASANIGAAIGGKMQAAAANLVRTAITLVRTAAAAATIFFTAGAGTAAVAAARGATAVAKYAAKTATKSVGKTFIKRFKNAVKDKVKETIKSAPDRVLGSFANKTNQNANKHLGGGE